MPRPRSRDNRPPDASSSGSTPASPPSGPAPAAPPTPAGGAPGDHFILNGRRIEVAHHATDVMIHAPESAPGPPLAPATGPPPIAAMLRGGATAFDPASIPGVEVAAVGGPRLLRGTIRPTPAAGPAARLATATATATASAAAPADAAPPKAVAQRVDEVMKMLRDHKVVTHHVYVTKDTGEELLLDDKVYLTLRTESDQLLADLAARFRLRVVGQVGYAHVLQVTDASGGNPIRVANALAAQPGVLACSPALLHQVRRADVPGLLPDQWPLASLLSTAPDLAPGVDLRILEAWEVTRGDADIVIAVIDDGFDLGHPAFAATRVHPDAKDFVTGSHDVAPRQRTDYHGTPVASLAVASGGAMHGVAPGCTFLPIRIEFGYLPEDVLLSAIKHAAARADVLVCSFATPPLTQNLYLDAFRDAVREIACTGGRRGRGLVICFAAGNDDAPTSLDATENVNGLVYLAHPPSRAARIPPGRPIVSSLTELEEVVVVGAISSRGRRSGYSNWGRRVTVCAPSDTWHPLPKYLGAADPDAAPFVAEYRGLGVATAVNRPGIGLAHEPIAPHDDPTTPDLVENHFTRRFGGTSSAAPQVAGVAALVLSANPSLSGAEVRRILATTARRDVLDPTPDLAANPNLQGVGGEFCAGRSEWFGHGLVDAAAAVRLARAMAAAKGGAPPRPPACLCGGGDRTTVAALTSAGDSTRPARDGEAPPASFPAPAILANPVAFMIDGEPVTEDDLAADQMLRRHFGREYRSPIAAAFEAASRPGGVAPAFLRGPSWLRPWMSVGTLTHARPAIAWCGPAHAFTYTPDEAAPFAFRRSNGVFIQPGPMETDGGSVPRLLHGVRGFSPMDFLPAYIIHDWEFHLSRLGRALQSYDEANITMGEVIYTLRERHGMEVGLFTIDVIYWAVQHGAQRAWASLRRPSHCLV